MRIGDLVRRLPWPVLLSAMTVGLVAARTRPPAMARVNAADDHGPSIPHAVVEPRWLQRERAAQRGRGRRANTPWQIPWRGWQDILLRVYDNITEHRLLAVAAGIVFFSLLAIFPAITALVSSHGLFADVGTISNHLSALSDLMPGGAFKIVQDEVGRIVAKGGGQLTAAFAFGLALAFWSANAGMKSLFDALNVIYEEKEKRSFLWLNVVSFTFTLGAFAVIVLAVNAVVVFPLVLAYLGVNATDPLLIRFFRWPIMFATIVIGLALLYRYGPSRRNARWRWVSVGSVFAATTWIIVSLGFSYYLARFANYDATYGSLGAVIGLMMWMWLSALVILAGAELNAEIEHQTARDTTEGRDKPLGARGATMADTVGAAKT
jgi:membrane protein